MSCKFSSVLLFVYLVCTIEKSIGVVQKLEFFVVAPLVVLDCTDDQYLVIKDWLKFRDSSLREQTDQQCGLSDKDAFEFKKAKLLCMEGFTKTQIAYCFEDPLAFRSENQHQLSDYNLQATVISATQLTNRDTTLTIIGDNTELCLKRKPKPWEENEEEVLYLRFDQYPVVCRSNLNYGSIIDAKTCDAQRGRNQMICYHKLAGETLLVTNMSYWELVDQLVTQADNDSDENLEKFGAVYFNLREVISNFIEILMKHRLTSIFKAGTAAE